MSSKLIYNEGGFMKESYTLKLEGKEWKECLKASFDKKKKVLTLEERELKLQ